MINIAIKSRKSHFSSFAFFSPGRENAARLKALVVIPPGWQKNKKIACFQNNRTNTKGVRAFEMLLAKWPEMEEDLCLDAIIKSYFILWLFKGKVSDIVPLGLIYVNFTLFLSYSFCRDFVSFKNFVKTKDVYKERKIENIIIQWMLRQSQI